MFRQVGVAVALAALVAGCANYDRFNLSAQEEGLQQSYVAPAPLAGSTVADRPLGWAAMCLDGVPKTPENCGLALHLKDDRGYWLKMYSQNEPSDVLTIAVEAPLESRAGRTFTLQTDNGITKRLYWKLCMPTCRAKMVFKGAEKELFLAAREVEVRYHLGTSGHGVGFVISLEDMKKALAKLAESQQQAQLVRQLR